MTDAELEELEALLAGSVCLPWRYGEMWRPPIPGSQHTGDRVDGEGNVFWGYSLSGSNENGGAILPTLGAVHNFPNQCESNARLIAGAVNALPSLISTIRELREENAELKRDRAPVTPEALAWGKEEAARIEAKEAARDRVVEAARAFADAKSSLIWSIPKDACESAKLGDDYEKADRALSAALAALEEQS